MSIYHSFKQFVVASYFAGACCLRAFGVDEYWALSWHELALVLIGILTEGVWKCL
jgi:hypothetical protein